MSSHPAALRHDDYFSLTALSPEAYVSLGSMEGMAEPTVRLAGRWPGYVLAALVTAAAYAIHYLPFAPFMLVGEAGVRRPISAAILAILLGALVANVSTVAARAGSGCKVIVRKLLPGMIVLAGAGLNLASLAGIGGAALLIVAACIMTGTVAGVLFSRWFGLSRRTGMLIGAGTAICGNSAIVAVAPLVDASDEDLALSITSINFAGLLAMLALPFLGALIHLGDAAFGVLAGSTVHAVPQAVAAGFAYSHAAGTFATLVKLVRVALLAPLVLLLAVHHARSHRSEGGAVARPDVHFARMVPWFVWGFVAMAAVRTLGLIPALEFKLPGDIWGADYSGGVPLAVLLSEVSTVLLSVAMAAIGLELRLRVLVGTGSRAILAGLAAAVVLIGVGLLLTRLMI
jgi:uncharacterized integral membrane protein (TIGR00698 family)